LLGWARRFPQRRWAIENARGLGCHLTQWLLARGETVQDVPGVRSWAHARPDSYGQDHQFKVGVQVRRGQTATLVIPAAFHRVAGLLYAEQARLDQTPAEADHAVTFTACADHHTPFIGGFFVLEPRCVPLEIRPAGGRPVREVISFFAGDR
jgi:hypothetical protein